MCFPGKPGMRGNFSCNLQRNEDQAGFPFVNGPCDVRELKDGVSFWYCAYVLRISGYSGFLRNLPPTTTTFLCVL